MNLHFRLCFIGRMMSAYAIQLNHLSLETSEWTELNELTVNWTEQSHQAVDRQTDRQQTADRQTAATCSPVESGHLNWTNESQSPCRASIIHVLLKCMMYELVIRNLLLPYIPLKRACIEKRLRRSVGCVEPRIPPSVIHQYIVFLVW